MNVLVVQNIDGINYELLEAFDMSFVSKYGKVFKVFDQQDSGCICFGVESEGKKIFIKVAGAKTVRSKLDTSEAIKNLQYACKVYEELRCKNLVSLIDKVEINDGYASIFEWTDAECMGKQYQSRHKFFELPIEERINIIDEILEFHRFVNKKGYVAIDFYDGSIMYDFQKKKTTICDIDYYSKKPYVNNMGRMWGSGRFMSPEEFEKGSIIDEITNVYLMGATAFALLGNPMEKSIEGWIGHKELFDVAKKAVNKDRNQRYQSLDEFADAWQRAKQG